MKIYIAGKIAGDRRYRAKFREAAKALEAAGHVVLNPATLPDGLTDADYMRICMAMVDAATGVILLSVQRGIQTAAGKSGHMNMEEIGLDRSGK